MCILWELFASALNQPSVSNHLHGNCKPITLALESQHDDKELTFD